LIPTTGVFVVIAFPATTDAIDAWTAVSRLMFWELRRRFGLQLGPDARRSLPLAKRVVDEAPL
jgi:hypothetical protein